MLDLESNVATVPLANARVYTEPDFFAVSGCESAEAVGILGDILKANARTFQIWTHANLKGMTIPDDEPSYRGFDIPIVLMTSLPPCQARAPRREAPPRV